jgi:hypothetical protein
MSGFMRDTTHYGGRLLYEALLSKWFCAEEAGLSP